MFDKLDAYNLVANLVPGAALAYALIASGFPLPQPNEIGAFLLISFVVGVVTNRFGSLVIDPILRADRVGFLHKKNYDSFVTSERHDAKLETIVANAGLYRTFFTAGLFYLLLLLGRCVLDFIALPEGAYFIVFVLFLMAVSFFALKKEDDYIHRRIAKRKSEDRL